jgi:hypothetical protein
MIANLENSTTSKLKQILMINRAKDTEQVLLNPINPVTLPNANNFAGYTEGQRKYFKVETHINFTEISEAEYLEMPDSVIY